ncbi:MAG: Fe-S oxidoreductase [Ruminococcaceae bacterium]|nr:Fe-S oxidoreductase [Oscillospiraceae bacterium]
MTDYFGKNTPKLGFGLMRLPKKGLSIDVEQVKQMVDMFMQAGFTYFDTAYLYLGSEGAIKKALIERYEREAFTLADKINAVIAPTEKFAKKEFFTSLERTGAGYFDYYLLHTIMESNAAKYEKFHLWDFVKEQKQKGLIKHYGFSFHGGPQLLDKLLTEHPDTEFVQLQLNYADWENKKITSRENYEVARRHGKSIIIMEPVKGGALAKPGKEIEKLFKAYAPDMSPASWAIRFAASLEGVLTVLSGMSNIAQMQDNLSYMQNFTPLGEEEQHIIRQAQHILGKSATVPCTACRYCTEGCPKKIAIPEVFAALNLQLGNGQLEQAKRAYAAAVQAGGKASDCIGCRRCENSCPQHIAITDCLKKAAQTLE